MTSSHQAANRPVHRMVYVAAIYSSFLAAGLAFGSLGLRGLIVLSFALALYEISNSYWTPLLIVAGGALSLWMFPFIASVGLVAAGFLLAGIAGLWRGSLQEIRAMYSVFFIAAAAIVLSLTDDVPMALVVTCIFLREFLGGLVGQGLDRHGFQQSIIRPSLSPNKSWDTYFLSSLIPICLLLALQAPWSIALPIVMCQWGDLSNSLFKRADGRRHSGTIFGESQGGVADFACVFAMYFLGYFALTTLPAWITSLAI